MLFLDTGSPCRTFVFLLVVHCVLSSGIIKETMNEWMRWTACCGALESSFFSAGVCELMVVSADRCVLVCVAFRSTKFGHCVRLFFLSYVLSIYNKIMKVTIGHFCERTTGRNENENENERKRLQHSVDADCRQMYDFRLLLDS